MKIVVDLRWIRSSQTDGIARYTIGLTKALQKEDLGLVFLYHKKDLLTYLKDLFGSAEFIHVPYDILTPSDWFRLPKYLEELDPDVYLTPHFITSPWHGGYKVVSIVHDLIPFLYRKYLSGASKKLLFFYQFPWIAEMMIKRADVLITDSFATKEDLCLMFGVAEEKVQVLYPGIDFIRAVPKKEGRYILYVGRMEPYKNLIGLIEAYAKLPANLREQYPLVIGGGTKEPYYSVLQEKVRSLGLGKQVQFKGFVPDEDLPELYANAAVFAFPSWYEGFGLPVIEARAAQVPVLTSNTSSLPEAAGEGGVLVDPHDTEAISTGLKKILEDEGLRKKLVSYNKGLADEFSWERSAKKLRDTIYEISKNTLFRN